METTTSRPTPRADRPDGDRRALRRTTDDRVWMGVAGGVGERLKLDSVAVRILFVLTSAIWGAGLVVYLAMAWAVPEVDHPSAAVWRPHRRAVPRAIALGLLVAGAMLLMRSWGMLPSDRFLLPWALMAAGVVVLWGRTPLRPIPRPALMPGPPNTLLTDVDFAEPEPARVEDQPAEPVHAAPADETDAESIDDEPIEPPESPPRRGRGARPALVPIGTLTAGSLLVSFGMLYLADDAGWMDVSWLLTGGVGLTVVGLALVAGGCW